MSRSIENDNHISNKNYKEIDILIGSELKNNNALEFRYAEPKKLKDIESFFIQFFILNNKHLMTNMFVDVNLKMLKYIDYDLLSYISQWSSKEINKVNQSNTNNKSLSLYNMSSINNIIKRLKDNIIVYKDKYIKNNNTYKKNKTEYVNTSNTYNTNEDNSDMFQISSELKPNINKNNNFEINKDFILSRNVSMSISKIEDFDNDLVVSKNLSFINRDNNYNDNTINSNNISVIHDIYNRDNNQADYTFITNKNGWLNYFNNTTNKKNSSNNVISNKKLLNNNNILNINVDKNKSNNNEDNQLDNSYYLNRDKGAFNIIVSNEENKDVVNTSNSFDDNEIKNNYNQDNIKPALTDDQAPIIFQ